jgi:hypothetical protein
LQQILTIWQKGCILNGKKETPNTDRLADGCVTFFEKTEDNPLLLFLSFNPDCQNEGVE